MRRFTILAALGGTAQASPRGWHFEKHSHPGWSEPSVYTPAQPEPSWPYQPWSSQSTRVESTSSPGPTVTDSAPSTTTAASSTLSGGYGTSTAACASVSELVASFTSQSPSATPTVPAELAYDCITSVPFNGSAAGMSAWVRGQPFDMLGRLMDSSCFAGVDPSVPGLANNH